jgi:hypothetical protein
MKTGALMSRALYISLILASGLGVSGQTATKRPDRPASTANPLSGYMRRTGLSYLEQIEDFQRECDGLKDTCSAALERWPRIFEELEDRITITLSESKRSAGDESFFELLKHAKDSRMYSFTLALLQQDHKPRYSSKKTLDMWTEVSNTCQTLAHQIALDGVYNATADKCAITYKQIKECQTRNQKDGFGRDGFYWDGVCHTDAEIDSANQAELAKPDVQGTIERKQFAQAAQERFIKRIPSLSITTEGSDATIFVWRATGVTNASCQDLFTTALAPILHKYGFSQFVCTDGNARFTFKNNTRLTGP